MSSCPTLINPIAQNLSSVRYVADAVYPIPTTDPDLWGVCAGKGFSCELVGIMTTEEMLEFFRQHWIAAVQRHNAVVAEHHTPTPTVSSLELDDILADLSL